MPLYAATIFLSAWLLFAIQPMMGKYLLPWFGGGAGVWPIFNFKFQSRSLLDVVKKDLRLSSEDEE